MIGESCRLANKHFSYGAEEIHPLGLYLYTAVSFPDFFFLLENPAIFKYEYGIFRQLFYGLDIIFVGVIALQHPKQIQVRTAGGCRIVHVIRNGHLDVLRKDSSLQERLHELPITGFPFLAMRLYTVFVCIPCFEMRKFMHRGDKECIGVEVVVYRNAMPVTAMRRAVIAKLGCTAPADAKLALAVVDPARNHRSSRGGHVFAKLNAVVLHPANLKQWHKYS